MPELTAEELVNLITLSVAVGVEFIPVEELLDGILEATQAVTSDIETLKASVDSYSSTIKGLNENTNVQQ